MTSSALPLPDPALQGEGFVLRPWRLDDAAALVSAWSDPEVANWTAVPARRGREAARGWIAGQDARRERGLSLDLVVESAGEVAGEVGLVCHDQPPGEAEIGWWVAAPHRGRGLATAAVLEMAEWVISELCLDVLVARCRPDNPASGAVARGAGFVKVPADSDQDLWCYPPAGGGTVQP